MNNLVCIGILAIGLCVGFFAGDYRGAWKVQKQAVARGQGRFILNEDSGLKSFEWVENKEKP